MRDSVVKRKGYILTALGGAAAGGLFVAVVARALARVIEKMREMMTE